MNEEFLCMLKCQILISFAKLLGLATWMKFARQTSRLFMELIILKAFCTPELFKEKFKLSGFNRRLNVTRTDKAEFMQLLILPSYKDVAL